MFLWKARCSCFGSTYSSLLLLHFHVDWKSGCISYGIMDEIVTAPSGPEALFWALLLRDSQIHHPCLKLHTKGKKNKKGIDLICKTL